MKFYINNKEMSEKVFWRTLESLVTPLQRVHILEGMKVKIADYLCWMEIVKWKNEKEFTIMQIPFSMLFLVFLNV